MKLSFSTKGWHDNTFEDFCTIAKDLKFQGIELHNIHNKLFTDKDGAFHDYTAAATVRKLYESKLTIPCIDSVCDCAKISEKESTLKEIRHCINIAKNLKIPAVRVKLVELQRKIAKTNDCVLDGRDIGSHVLPNADYKFYLTANSHVRALRRQAELAAKGEILTVEEIQKDIEKRDLQDQTRAYCPLVICDDAVLIDTSSMNIEDVTNAVMKVICK